MSRQNSQKWKTLRRRFLDSLEDNRCAGCGEAVNLSLPGSHVIGPTVDHIKSVKHFPELEYELSNLQLMCSACNKSKHAGPRSRQQRRQSQYSQKDYCYPGQTKWMTWRAEYNIFVNGPGYPMSVNDHLVTFNSNGEIVKALPWDGKF